MGFAGWHGTRDTRAAPAGRAAAGESRRSVREGGREGGAPSVDLLVRPLRRRADRCSATVGEAPHAADEAGPRAACPWSTVSTRCPLTPWPASGGLLTRREAERGLPVPRRAHGCRPSRPVAGRRAGRPASAGAGRPAPHTLRDTYAPAPARDPVCLPPAFLADLPGRAVEMRAPGARVTIGRVVRVRLPSASHPLSAQPSPFPACPGRSHDASEHHRSTTRSPGPAAAVLTARRSGRTSGRSCPGPVATGQPAVRPSGGVGRAAPRRGARGGPGHPYGSPRVRRRGPPRRT
ncbi:hypothetical protein SUDANB70_00049 [Streptomyces sp. enrichment culture]